MGEPFRFRFRRFGLFGVGTVIVLYIVLSLAFELGLPYPSILVSSLVLLGCQAYVVSQYGLLSVPSLFTALVTYPALVPFAADFVFHTPNYTLRAIPYESPALVRRVLFLIAIFTLLFVATLRALDVDDSPRRCRQFRTSGAAFLTLSVINVLAAYLTTPGPTILTADYVTVLNAWFPWAAFAGALYLGSWAMLYLLSRPYDVDSLYYRGLIFVSFVGVGWLLLHARRNEAMGVLTLLAIDYVANRRTEWTVVQRAAVSVATVAGMLLGGIFVGIWRGSGRISTSIRDLFVGSSGTPQEFIAAPGGAHNVFGTVLATVDIVGRDVPYLLGETFLKYPVQAIPSGVFAVTELPYPSLYHDLLGKHYVLYNGGNYFLNTYYANFGEAGVLFGALLLGWIVSFTHSHISDQTSVSLRAGVGVVLALASFRAMWYTQLNWLDNLEGFLAAYLVYVVVTNVYNSSEFRSVSKRLVGRFPDQWVQ